MISNIKKIIWLVIYLSFLSGCANISIQSTKDPNFKNEFNDLYVVINNGQLLLEYSLLLADPLDQELESKNIKHKISIVNPLELDESIYAQKINEYRPEGVLVILANGGVTDPYGGMPKIFYDVSVYEFPNKKRVWRARINNSGGAAVTKMRMEKMVKELVARLLEEKVVSSEPNIKDQSF